MKKSIFILATLFAFVINVNAQNPNFQKGQIDANVGVGIISVFTGVGVNTVMPPLSASVDYAITDNISIGGFLGYSTGKTSRSSFSDGTYYQWKFNYVLTGVRGAWHFDLTDKLDTYAGLMLGYIVVSSDLETNDPWLASIAPAAASGIGWSAYAGARYQLNDQFGVFGELGYGVSVLTLGATAKF